MPALMPTEFTARITWLGRVEKGGEGIRSVPLEAVHASYAGVEGEVHAGLTRPACTRVRDQYPTGTEIRNVRQFSIVSAEEMAAIAAEIGVEALAPEWLGASIVIEGIPDFSHVPPSSRLQNADGTALVIDMQNRPCIYPGKEIEKDRPGHGKAFKPAAEGRRGVTAWVEREGPLRVGDVLRLHIPDQRAWAHFQDQAQAAE
ncbi:MULTISPECIES: MOSC domain-containing protein [unclassified Roseovarius]|uniref:MOSC domain-containing protein n=1 Tax=unclassified Roseovarius TaxID=2614913 RepID=UPI00273F022D|nr:MULTISPECIES: MOSC domain-containing protein [unclassified Roseovarius]